jgi:hypothetical protein
LNRDIQGHYFFDRSYGFFFRWFLERGPSYNAGTDYIKNRSIGATME